MTKIHIPPAALEAGARAIAESLRTARLTLESEDGYKPEARAAFVAMVEAWPGMHTHEWQRPWLGGMSGIDLILPLPPPPAGETND